MRLMNIFPQFARNLLMRSRRKLTVTKVVLNILTSPTKDSVLLRQIAVKYFHYWINLANQKQPVSIKFLQDLLRECADLICIYICKIFNCSLTTGIFPDDWKCAKLTPLFKQGVSSGMNNYRPISVISVVARVATPHVGWVCCWFPPLLRETFRRVLRFSLSSKTNTSNSNSIWNARTRLNEFIWTPKCFVRKKAI